MPNRGMFTVIYRSFVDYCTYVICTYVAEDNNV